VIQLLIYHQHNVSRDPESDNANINISRCTLRGQGVFVLT